MRHYNSYSTPKTPLKLTVIVGAALMALTACGGGGSGGEGSDDGGSATSGTVNWWSWTPDNNVAEREIAAFNKQYPDIKVIYKKVPWKPSSTRSPPSASSATTCSW